MNLSENNALVSVRKVATYDPERIFQAVSEIYAAAGGPDPRGKRVLLKPNILADLKPERAVTTHPEVFRACARFFQEQGAVVLAGDSPGIHSAAFTGRVCGIRQVCEELGIEWVDFTKDPLTRNGFKLARIIDEADLIVSLPKCKTHELAYFTGATKNLFGLIPGFSKAMLHVKYPNRHDFSAMVIDLLYTVKPAFAFMDAIIGMEGAGPQNGKPKHIGLLLGSCNLIALDMTAARIVGYDPLKIPMFANALERGIGLNNIADIVLEGGDLKDLRVKNFKRIPIEHHYNLVVMGVRLQQIRRRFDRRPFFDHSRCILCQKCVQMCKSEALSVKDGKICIDDRKCIRCFCCHEICPVNAIEIKRKVFG
ncbi:MAG: DUF362 domain-containing protein [Candidatus Marinimicrobia bacterium]|nr:DUF362 domain-containing protein [Candidatus Neomarinimicrobiota bacterium]